MSARETYLEITLTEKPIEIETVTVRPCINKAEPLNAMATVGVRVFSVEEASRYAGGMDDPARLATSFAGVVAEAANNNGISIHGNSPALLQWRIAGVEVPNVNHFADITQAGGGFLSALSSNVVGNSDFFVGAMPAEYANAVSGVLDMRLRNGSSNQYQHTFQLGMQGIDLASEGPISRKTGSSYIANYRYSTLGLLQGLSGSEERMGYQDLNFNLNFPTKKAGTLSLWGMGLADDIKSILEDPAEWKYPDDGIVSNADLASDAAGLSHKFLFRDGNTSLNTILVATLQRVGIDEDIYDTDKFGSPMSDMSALTTSFILNSYVNHKFGARHTNRTGVTATHSRGI